MRFFLAVIFVLITIVSDAQNITLFYKRYGVEEGLSDASCNEVFEDSRGFIWVGTQGGLNRFDGHRFIHFYHKPGDSTTLCSNTVTHITESADGNIWVGTYGGGISCIEYLTQKIVSYRLKTEDAPETRSNRITGIAHLSDGKIVVSTEGGLFIKEPQESEFSPAHLKLDVSPNFSKKACYVQYHRASEKLWIEFFENIHCYDVREHALYSRKHNPKQWNIFSKVPNIITSRNVEGKIFSTDEEGKLWSYDYEKDELTPICPMLDSLEIRPHMIYYSEVLESWLISSWEKPAFFLQEKNCTIDATPFTEKYKGSVGDVRIRKLLTDSQGNEWLASGNGLFVRNAKDVQRELVKFKDDVLKINHVLENPDGCWLATQSGISRTESYPKCEAFCDHPISYFYPKNEHEILVGTDEGVAIWKSQNRVEQLLMPFTDSSKFSYKKDIVQFMHIDTRGRLWIGNWSGNLTCVDTTSYQTIYHFSRPTHSQAWPTSGLLSMYEYQGEMLIGFNGGDGVWKWDEQHEEFSPFISSENNLGLVAVIDDIYADDQYIFLGTHGGGLAQWSRQSGQMKYLSRSDGLPGDFIYNILPNEDGTMWLVTNAGVCSFQPTDGSISILNTDFVQEIPLYSHSGSQSLQDKIWFWMQNNLYSIQLHGNTSQSIALAITGFEVFGHPRNNSEMMELAYHENYITIEFSAFNFTHQERIEYSYKLSGISEDWVNHGDQSTVNFSSLADGEYVFHVRARYNGGTWSEPKQIAFVIHPPFWRRWWFYALVMMFLAGIVYLVYRYRLAQILKMQQMRNRISSDLHDDVGASLSSINIFSKVALKKIKDNPESTERMLEQISQNATEMMDSMSDIVWSINPKNDTLNSLLNRIKQHSNEVLSSLEIQMRYDIAIQENQQLSMIARKNIFLICKEAINNIAKHSGAQQASLKLHQEGQTLLLEIMDDGNGMEIKSGKGGNGMSSMISRAKEMGGTLIVEPNQPKGTRIILKLHITRISDNNDPLPSSHLQE